ncbi:MAG TPA: Hsp20/alpha crystallin family protein [Kofleriaceae bacterium]|nr:Hsp20/alpha crystallin family protein [Kofleriaceae bacterium]
MATNTNEQALTKPEPDLYRWMRDMMRWDPFQSTTLPSFFGPGYERTFTPAFEVKETKDSFLFKADLPGMKESDIDVKITGNRLAITGKREAEYEDKNDTYYTYERSFGSFQRTFMLPEGLDTDHVHAELKDGVLTVALPKLAGAQTKNIAIKSGEKTKS